MIGKLMNRAFGWSRGAQIPAPIHIGIESNYPLSNMGRIFCIEKTPTINNKTQLIRHERKHIPMGMRSSVINRRTIAIKLENRIARNSYKQES
jgi:hypothetical protein